MSLLEVNIPSPKKLRGGWAVKAAIDAAQGGNNTYVFAEDNFWYYNDGSGNWACLRFRNDKQAVLFGYDHEYSQTFFKNAAQDFRETETNLLKDAPSWWAELIEPPDDQPYVGFIYGWDSEGWSRASYQVSDGFKHVGLLQAIKVIGRNSLSDSLIDFPESWRPKELWNGLVNYILVVKILRNLVNADARISQDEFEQLVQLDSRISVTSPKYFPVVDSNAGVLASRKFTAIDIN